MMEKKKKKQKNKLRQMFEKKSTLSKIQPFKIPFSVCCIHYTLYIQLREYIRRVVNALYI